MWEAGICLLDSSYYRQAAMLFWFSIRDCIFEYLEMKNTEYDSTRKALLAVISEPGLSTISSEIMFVYSIGTMTEWDENFFITKAQLLDYMNRCSRIAITLKH